MYYLNKRREKKPLAHIRRNYTRQKNYAHQKKSIYMQIGKIKKRAARVTCHPLKSFATICRLKCVVVVVAALTHFERVCPSHIEQKSRPKKYITNLQWCRERATSTLYRYIYSCSLSPCSLPRFFFFPLTAPLCRRLKLLECIHI